jgi:hypothetical protein
MPGYEGYTLIKNYEGFTYLAVPIIRGMPFPAMPHIFALETAGK